jgi:acyl-CoA thioesterase FadM
VIKHSLTSKKLDKKVAEGEAHIVWYDYDQKKKAIIPDNLREKLLKS